jgi:hypothetical protein
VLAAADTVITAAAGRHRGGHGGDHLQLRPARTKSLDAIAQRVRTHG